MLIRRLRLQKIAVATRLIFGCHLKGTAAVTKLDMPFRLQRIADIDEPEPSLRSDLNLTTCGAL